MLIDTKTPKRKDVNKMKDSMDPAFPVAVIDTPASTRCQLKGVLELQIHENGFSLCRPSDKTILYTWPYTYVRRFGRSSRNFQFEAGRKCTSGEGLFSLLTEEGAGHQIFSAITDRFQHIKSSPHSTPSSTPQQTPESSPVPSICDESDYDYQPQLPPRNYKLKPASKGILKTSPSSSPKPRSKARVAFKLAESAPTLEDQPPRHKEAKTKDTESSVTLKGPSAINFLIAKNKIVLQEVNNNNNNEESGGYELLSDYTGRQNNNQHSYMDAYCKTIPRGRQAAPATPPKPVGQKRFHVIPIREH